MRSTVVNEIFTVDEIVSVRDRLGDGREIYRGRVREITITQILVEPVAIGSAHVTRFHRHTGLHIGSAFGDRKICKIKEGGKS